MSGKDSYQRRRRPVRWTIVAVVVSIALIGSGWFAATLFTSPAQRNAAAAAPATEPILARVESGDLVDTRTLSGAIRPIDAFDAVLVASGADKRSVITSLNVAKGASVGIGSVVATVNGQPVLALQSPFPLYRDLGVGDSGPDVRSLQESLVSMGLLSGTDGKFGPATVSGVMALFAQAGFDSPRRDMQSTTSDAVGAGVITPAAPADKAATKPAQVVYFPMTSAITVPKLPAIVGSEPQVGAEVGAATAFSFTSQTLAVFATPPASLPAGLVAGMKVTVSGAGLQDASATVGGTVASPGTPATSGSPLPPGNADPNFAASGATAVSEVRIDLDDASLMNLQLNGQSVSVTVKVKEVAKGALIVPVTAVAEDDATHGHVLVVSGVGVAKRIAVTIIGSVGGRVAIEPVGLLKPGDQVRVK